MYMYRFNKTFSKLHLHCNIAGKLQTAKEDPHKKTQKIFNRNLLLFLLIHSKNQPILI